MVLDLIVNVIDLLIWIGLFVAIYTINKRLTKIEQADTKTDKLLEWVDKNSFDISKAVNDVKDTFDEFQLKYTEVGKMLDALNCPIYKFVFGKNNEVIISYDFKTVTTKFNDDAKTFTDWRMFKEYFIDFLSTQVEFKNEPIVNTEPPALDEDAEQTLVTAEQLVEDLKPKKKTKKKTK